MSSLGFHTDLWPSQLYVLLTVSYNLFFSRRPYNVIYTSFLNAFIDRQPEFIIMQLCATQQSHEGMSRP